MMELMLFLLQTEEEDGDEQDDGDYDDAAGDGEEADK